MNCLSVLLVLFAITIAHAEHKFFDATMHFASKPSSSSSKYLDSDEEAQLLSKHPMVGSIIDEEMTILYNLV